MAVVYTNLPHTEFPKACQYEPQMNHYEYQASSAPQKQEQHVNYPPPPPPRSCFSPQLTRDFYQTGEEETASIQHQVSYFTSKKNVFYPPHLTLLMILNYPRKSFNNPFRDI